jgi:hypothetical protein
MILFDASEDVFVVIAHVIQICFIFLARQIPVMLLTSMPTV